ncbi:nuclease HARBI1 [Trichonephila clavipes]|nr:nuclease HARBI1 [Trichonephila clavipes]
MCLPSDIVVSDAVCSAVGSNVFEELDDYEFQRRFRLTKQSVAELTLLIEEKLESKIPCNNALNPVEQVLIALRFYAVSCMQLAIADLFDVSQPTVCRVVHRVSEAIASLLPDFIHLPVNREECKTERYETSESDSDYRGGLVAALDSGPQEISLYRIGCVSYTPQFIIMIHVLYYRNHSSGYSTFQCY